MKKYQVTREVKVTVTDYIYAIDDDDAMVKSVEELDSLISEISKAEHRLIDNHINVMYNSSKTKVKVLD